MYRVSSSPDLADTATEVVLLHITQPFPNHNGGQLRFGPDGYLYIGMGDGGSGGDPMANGQRRDTLLGKLLRIDVESDPGHVRIPPGNPFAQTSGSRPEIWATGVRNPWRFSFDSLTGDLWIADVGQDTYEEIDFQPAYSKGGENYGWNVMEGLHCYRPGCSQAGLTLPVTEYNHTLGCSVTGGFVYRGQRVPRLRGVYLFGDYCSGRIWGFDAAGLRVLLPSGFSITTFGQDEAGEIYVADARTASILRIDGSPAPYVLNAASFDAGVTPGSLASVFTSGVVDVSGILQADRVPLPLSLGGISVLVDGIPAPILAVAKVNGVEQVNFQVPWETSAGVDKKVVVTRGSQSATVTAPASPSQPAVFSGTDRRAVAVHNTGFTLVTDGQPLERGEYAFVYATGLGAVSNRPATGAGGPLAPLASVSRIEALLAGQPCEVQFAGLAPGFVGVYQVNFRVRPDAPSGLQSFRLRVSDIPGPTVFVPVR
jgi:uncharacterized protein (TIGR03437 family)